MKKYIKLCGINDIEILKGILSSEYKPDFLGFIFYEPSSRSVSLDLAEELSNLISGDVKKVAVTVNASDDELSKIVNSLRPDYIQLHGDESPKRISEVRAKFGLPIIKAASISEDADLKTLEQYQGLVDYLLFDTKTKDYGGSGKSFDWGILEKLDIDRPYFLSGGLNIDNLPDATSQTNANYFDLSSGIELQKGVKDPKKIAEILDYFKGLNEKADT